MCLAQDVDLGNVSDPRYLRTRALSHSHTGPRCVALARLTGPCLALEAPEPLTCLSTQACHPELCQEEASTCTEPRVSPSSPHFARETGCPGPRRRGHEGGGLQPAARLLWLSFRARLPSAVCSSCNDNAVRAEPEGATTVRGRRLGEAPVCRWGGQRSTDASLHPVSGPQPL